MTHVFLTGIPTSGKSYLAEKIAKRYGVRHIDTDAFRAEMEKDLKLEPWVNYYWNLDEERYYRETTFEKQREELIAQSEAFWPFFAKKIREIAASAPAAIFEGVNILPHLAMRDFDFPGIILLGTSFEETFERNKKNPRWGKTEGLQRKEAEGFFYADREVYRREAEQFGWKAYTDVIKAESELMRLFRA